MLLENTPFFRCWMAMWQWLSSAQRKTVSGCEALNSFLPTVSGRLGRTNSYGRLYKATDENPRSGGSGDILLQGFDPVLDTTAT